MLTYNGSTYTWMGRELRKITNSSNTYSYKYNADGIRTSKTVNGTTTEFFLNGSQILAQKTGDSVMRFFYDSTGKRVGFANGTMLFYYLYNLQGDVIAIVRATTGQIVAKYSYDAWGNCTVTNATGYAVGDKNPFRYRGYYYDTETGLYYLNSRYYNPEFGRFISADGLIDNRGATSQNLFAYCGNNPINDSDPDGTLSLLAKIAIGIGAVVVGAAIVAATAGTASVFLGAVVTGLKSAALSGAISAAVGAGYSAVEHRISTGSWSGAEKAAIGGAVDGFANGVMTGGVMAGGSQALSSGFNVAAKAGVPTGRNGGLTIGKDVRVLSPNHPKAFETGGTMLKIESKYKNIRFDVGSKSLFHMNIQLSKAANHHLPIGIFGAGILGGFTHD